MGFFSKLFSVDTCPYFGSSDLYKNWDGRYYNSHPSILVENVDMHRYIIRLLYVHVVESHRKI